MEILNDYSDNEVMEPFRRFMKSDFCGVSAFVVRATEMVKAVERQALKEALTKYGKNVDGGYEVHFEGTEPMVAAYDFGEPCDMCILTARVDGDGNLSVIGYDKKHPCCGRYIDTQDIFAGQLNFVTAEITHYGQTEGGQRP